ncbi:penicillin-binding protein 1A [Anaerolineae bacterium]|nr:penicillin-binding protein 1A [Anaerolineae bacterium]
MATNARHDRLTIRRRRQRRLHQRQMRQRGLISAMLILTLFGVVGVVILIGGGIGALVGVYTYYAKDLPPPNEIVQIRQQFETTQVYDRTGKTVIYQVLDPAGDRQYVPLGELPRDLINATVAIEDKSFYTNPGFDLRGISRAFFTALQGGQIQGASTITQQLVKNTLIAPEERTAITQDRKIKEIILSLEISRLYSKDQILEWYLNTNFYGNLAYGVGTAAQVYFGKRAQDLNLGEAAMLAAIPQNPQLNPIDDWIAARQRQAVVLDSMVSAGYLTTDEAEAAKSQVIIIRPPTERYGIIAPHFALYARRQAEELLNAQGLDGARLVLGNGLKIYTTLDLDLFYQTECVIRAHIERIAGGNPTSAPNTGEGKPCFAAQNLPVPPKLQLGVSRQITNAAAVIIDPVTGQIRAMVGSIDYYNTGIQGNFNAALGLRQPGSAFKPFVYVTAFAAQDKTYTPATMVLDVPTTFNQGGTPYTPRNEDGTFHGVMSIRKALANSYNIPAVQVIRDITVGQVLRRARQLGFNTLTRPLDQYGLALALGSGEVTLVDLTYAYTTFANLGFMTGTPVTNPRPGFRTLDPVAVLRIEDRDGNILWQYSEADKTFGRQNMLSDALAYLINAILSDNEARLPAFGVGNALELSRPAAVKTGTTNDARDAWTVGYTPSLVAGVWVGNNDNRPMGDDVTGALAAAPIWHAIMEYTAARDSHPAVGWQRPESIIEASVCQDSGLLPTPDCPRVKELFYTDPVTGSSTLPTQQDIYWKRYRINVRNGLLATAITPPELVTEQVFFDYPPEALEWAQENGMPTAPTEYDAGGSRVDSGAGEITTPAGLARVRGLVEIRGVLVDALVAGYVLEFGVGINPQKWFPIGGGDPIGRGEDVLLGKWDTTNLTGLYTLRLGMTLKDQTFQPRTLQITVDNHAPTVNILSPLPNAEIDATNSVVTINADVIDDIEVARVEFYWNDQLLSSVEEAPYSAAWRIVKLGAQQFSVIAYDAAGNTTRSPIIEVIIK